MDKYVQFKKLLEYFVAHLNWLQNKKTTLNGYAEYIEPLLNSESFISTGQGYNQQKIQKQIYKWDKFKDGQICINVQGRYGDYKSVKCYLNWLGTGINIVAKWSDNEVIGLCMIIYLYCKVKPTCNTSLDCRNIAALRLFQINEFVLQLL